MDENEWRKALTEHRVKIVKELANPEAVADCLYSSGILTAEMNARICVSNMTSRLYVYTRFLE